MVPGASRAAEMRVRYAKIARVAPLLALGAAMLGWGCPSQSEREIWAQVNGTYIYREDAEKFYRILVLRNLQARTMEEATGFKLSILNELITHEIMVQQAKKSGIEASEVEVDGRMADLRNPQNLEEFAARLAQEGLNEEEVRAAVLRSLLIQKLLERDVTARITVNEDEIADYYRRNRNEFDVPETEYYLAQILVTPRTETQVFNLKNDDAKGSSAASQKIRALQALIEAGEDFGEVAENYSEDPNTSPAGGVLGFVRPSSLDLNPELRRLKRVISSLEVGQVSRVVQTARGFYLIKLLDKQEPGQHDLSDPKIRETIRQYLQNEKAELLRMAYREQLRNRAKVVNYLAEKIIAARGNRAVINETATVTSELDPVPADDVDGRVKPLR